MLPLLTVHQASASYPVWFGRGMAGRAGSLLSPRGDVFVVAAEALLTTHGERVAASFSPRPRVIGVADGEARKTLPTAESIVTALLERGARRDATLVAVGGGMIGDTAGFAAAIFMRGIDVVQVPTTLLSQVDSSLGGKVGVNHPLGKNLVGAFHPPRAVVTDPELLDTLPGREFSSGWFEVLKGGVIGDPALFEIFESGTPRLLARDPSSVDEAIRRKIAVKAAIVSTDERESGVRRLLNYGHTIGHALETAMRYEGIMHGEAVGWGMLAANALAVRRGVLGHADASRIDAAVRGLPLPPLAAGREDVLAAAAHDKKNATGARVMVLPRGIGDCVIADDVSEEEVSYAVAAILG